MAKILFSVSSNIDELCPDSVDAYFQNMIDSLAENGNDVFVLKTNGLVSFAKRNADCFFGNREKLLFEIRNFSPDLIITPNHEIPLVILENTDCRILVYTADNPIYFHQNNYMKKNIDRYVFMHGGWENFFTKYLKDHYGVREENNFFIGHVTKVHAKKVPLKSNIIFIGFVGWPQIAQDEFSKVQDQKQYQKLICRYEKEDVSSLPYTQLKTSNIRIKTLDAIQDLGLTVYGIPSNFLNTIGYSWELFKCFNCEPVFTTQKTEELLNSALIAPHLYNYQAPIGLSWRVADVMASNACLISPPKPDLKRLSPYIDIPTYDSPAECRELCQKLLKDESRRREIVEGSQKAVEEFCRYDHTLKTISKFTGFSLINPGVQGSVVFYRDVQKTIGKAENRKHPGVMDRLYYKLWKHFNKKAKKRGLI